jgi:hypothetical protein
MRSAYATFADEPDFTNFAWTSWDGRAFCAALDYIWLSAEWEVRGVKRLPTRAAVRLTRGTLPSLWRPW